MEFGIEFLFFAGLITGAIGLVLGMIVDKALAGFWLGAFLGPIGWIIVFLLPRAPIEEQNSSHHQVQPVKPLPSPSVKRDLNSDSYKLYLGKKYEIQRNDLFQKFECREKLFESLEEALAFADELDKDEISVAEEKNKALGRKLDWMTIKDNLIRDGITVHRSAPLWGESEYQVRYNDELLIFKTLEELQDYYMSVVTSTSFEPELRYENLDFNTMKHGFNTKKIKLMNPDKDGFHDLIYPHIGVAHRFKMEELKDFYLKKMNE